MDILRVAEFRLKQTFKVSFHVQSINLNYRHQAALQLRVKHRSFQADSSRAKLSRGLARFDETLVLPVLTYYNQRNEEYDQTVCTLIIYLYTECQKKKTAGFAKIDISNFLRESRADLDIALEESVDEEARLKAKLQIEETQFEEYEASSTSSYELVSATSRDAERHDKYAHQHQLLDFGHIHQHLRQTFQHHHHHHHQLQPQGDTYPDSAHHKQLQVVSASDQLKRRQMQAMQNQVKLLKIKIQHLVLQDKGKSESLQQCQQKQGLLVDALEKAKSAAIVIQKRLQASQKQASKQIADLRQKLKTTQKESGQKSQRIGSLQPQLLRVRLQCKNLQLQIQVLRESSFQKDKTIAGLERSSRQLKFQLSDREEMIQILRKENVVVAATKKKLQLELSKFQANFPTRSSSVRRVDEEKVKAQKESSETVAALQKSIAALKRNIIELKQQKQNNEQEYNKKLMSLTKEAEESKMQTQRVEAAHRQTIQTQTRNQNKLKSQLQEIRQVELTLKKQLECHQRQLEEAKRLANKQQAEITVLKSREAELGSRTNSLKEEVKLLQAQLLQSRNEIESKNIMLEKLKKESQVSIGAAVGQIEKQLSRKQQQLNRSIEQKQQLAIQQYQSKRLLKQQLDQLKFQLQRVLRQNKQAKEKVTFGNQEVIKLRGELQKQKQVERLRATELIPINASLQQSGSATLKQLQHRIQDLTQQKRESQNKWKKLLQDKQDTINQLQQRLRSQRLPQKQTQKQQPRIEQLFGMFNKMMKQSSPGNKLQSLQKQVQALRQRESELLRREKEQLGQLQSRERELQKVSQQFQSASGQIRSLKSALRQCQDSLRRQRLAHETALRESQGMPQQGGADHMLCQMKISQSKEQIEDLKEKNRQMKNALSSLRRDKDDAVRQNTIYRVRVDAMENQKQKRAPREETQSREEPFFELLSKELSSRLGKPKNQLEFASLQAKIDRLQSKLKEREKALAEEVQRSKSLEAQRKRIQLAHRQLSQQLIVSKYVSERQQQRAKRSIEDLQLRLAESEEQVNSLQQQLSKASSTSRDLTKTVDQLQARKRELAALGLGLQHQIREKRQLKLRIEELEVEHGSKFKQQKERAERLAEQLEQANQQMLRLRRMQGDIQIRKQQADKNHVHELNQLKQRLEDSNRRAISLQSTAQLKLVADRSISQLSARISGLQRELQAVSSRLKEKQQESGRLTFQLEKAGEEISTQRYRIRELQMQAKFKEQTFKAKQAKLIEQGERDKLAANGQAAELTSLSARLKAKQLQLEKGKQEVSKLRFSQKQLEANWDQLMKYKEESLNSRNRIALLQDRLNNQIQKTKLLDAANVELARLRGETGSAKMMLDEQSRLAEQRLRELDSEKSANSQLRKALAEFECKLIVVEKEKKHVEKQGQLLAKELDRANTCLSKKEAQIETLRNQALSANQQKSNICSERERLHKQLNSRRKQIQELSLDLEKHKMIQQMQRRQLQKLQQIPRLNSVIRDLESRARESELAKQKYQFENGLLKKSIGQLESQAKRMASDAEGPKEKEKEREAKQSGLLSLKVQSLSHQLEDMKQRYKQKTKQIEELVSSHKSELNFRNEQLKSMQQKVLHLSEQSMQLRKSSFGLPAIDHGMVRGFVDEKGRSGIMDRVVILQRQLISKTKQVQELQLQKERKKIEEGQKQILFEKQKKIAVQNLEAQIRKLKESAAEQKKKQEGIRELHQSYSKQKVRNQKLLESLSQGKKELEARLTTAQQQREQMEEQLLKQRYEADRDKGIAEQFQNLQEEYYLKHGECQALVEKYHIACEQLKFMLDKEPQTIGLLSELQVRVVQQEDLIGVLRDGLAGAKQAIAYYEEHLGAERRSYSDQKSVTDQLTTRTETMHQQIKLTQKRLLDMSQKCQYLKRSNQSLVSQLTQKTKLLAESQLAMGLVKKQAAETAGLLKTSVTKAQFQHVVCELERKNSQLQIQLQSFRGKSTHIAQVQEILSKLKFQKFSFQSQFQQLQSANTLLTQEMQRKGSQLVEAQHRIKVWEAELSLLVHRLDKGQTDTRSPIKQIAQIQAFFYKIRSKHPDSEKYLFLRQLVGIAMKLLGLMREEELVSKVAQLLEDNKILSRELSSLEGRADALDRQPYIQRINQLQQQLFRCKSSQIQLRSTLNSLMQDYQRTK